MGNTPFSCNIISTVESHTHTIWINRRGKGVRETSTNMPNSCVNGPRDSTASPLESVHPPQCASHWRDEGYPGFSRWMASSDDFLILRRFSQLNVRVLLLMQDRIVRKEEELVQKDKDGRQGRDEEADCSSLRYDPLPGREKILDELKSILREYSQSFPLPA